MCFQAILYNLIIIGESVKKLDGKFLDAHSDINWRGIADLRNLIAHEYFRIEASKIRLYIDAPLRTLAAAFSV